MHHKKLEEFAKFGAGLIAGDFLAIVWIANANLLPIDFFGRAITMDVLAPALMFDTALFFILIHYGWNIGKIPALRERSYFLIATVIFAIVAGIHLARIFMGGEIIIAGWAAPIWLSWVGIAVTLYLAYMSFRLGFRMKKR